LELTAYGDLLNVLDITGRIPAAHLIVLTPFTGIQDKEYGFRGLRSIQLSQL
jgi:hypothetical protein